MIVIRETAAQLIVSGEEKEIDTLWFRFRFRPNGYLFAVSYQRYKVSEGAEGWDGFIYPFQRVNYTTGVIGRGRLNDVLRIAEDERYEVDHSQLLPNPLATLEIDDVRPDLIAGKFKLDPRQRDCILNWVQAGVGFNKVSVGGGKTEIFAGAAALVREHLPGSRFIYITPSERLVRQTAVRMKDLLPGWDVGQYGGGKHQKDAADMVICTSSILSRNFNTLFKERFFDSFTAVLYDEVHHSAAPSSQKVLNTLTAFYRFGASDSDKEKDPAKFYAIRSHFGPKLSDVKSVSLIDIGRLAKPHIYVVDIPAWKGRFESLEHTPKPNSPAYMLIDGAWVQGKYLSPVYEKDKKTGEIVTRPYKTAVLDEHGEFIVEQRPVITKGLHLLEIDGVQYEVESRWCLLERTYDRAIIQFKSRNELVVRWATFFSKKKWSTVVVATRTTHVYILEALLKKVLDPELVRILIGYEDSSPKQRDEMFDWFRNTPGAVLVTPLVKEGVSINQIKAVVVADHVADHEVARQIVGRALRPKEIDNRAHVVWFWDRQSSTLSRGCRKVLEHLQAAEGFHYYHPCTVPEAVQQSIV